MSLYCGKFPGINMSRLTVIFVVLGLVSFVVAGPAVTRSRQDIEAFRQFLEDVRKGNNNGDIFQANKKSSPNANEEELSGRYEGDIVLDDEDVEMMLHEYAAGRNAFTSPTVGAWPDNTVIFEIVDGQFTEEQVEAIWRGVRDIEANTCVKFRYRTTETVYARVTGAPDGCYAHVGYVANRGARTLNLAPNAIGVGCFRHATIVHEFMHTLSFFHMQSTYDRDDYVRINEENIIPGRENNFNLYTADSVDNLEVDYDYVSCLHYSAYAFSLNGERTIQALQEHEGEMGQRVYITDKDWLRINRYYNCPGAWD